VKDLIISGGFNVYPAEIENVLAEQPCVHESAVIGLPDPDWGERVVAVVEATDGEPCDVEQLAAHVRARLGPVKTPKEIVTVASLPRNANGKILKHVLVAELGSRSRPPVG
jgi:acyl-CoA synthetase (AMP-forming)/AMP-acid ligase II